MAGVLAHSSLYTSGSGLDSNVCWECMQKKIAVDPSKERKDFSETDVGMGSEFCHPWLCVLTVAQECGTQQHRAKHKGESDPRRDYNLN